MDYLTVRSVFLLSPRCLHDFQLPQRPRSRHGHRNRGRRGSTCCRTTRTPFRRHDPYSYLRRGAGPLRHDRSPYPFAVVVRVRRVIRLYFAFPGSCLCFGMGDGGVPFSGLVVVGLSSPDWLDPIASNCRGCGKILPSGSRGFRWVRKGVVNTLVGPI